MLMNVTRYLRRKDEFGVDEWNTLFKVSVALGVFYAYIGIAAFVLAAVESTDPAANILTYRDAFWALQMAASTIGFGDYHPVTDAGRSVVVISFYIGVGLMSYVGFTLASRLLSFTETGVKNRELRLQLMNVLKHNEHDARASAELLAHNKQLEQRVVQLLDKLETRSHPYGHSDANGNEVFVVGEKQSYDDFLKDNAESAGR